MRITFIYFTYVIVIKMIIWVEYMISVEKFTKVLKWMAKASETRTLEADSSEISSTEPSIPPEGV